MLITIPNIYFVVCIALVTGWLTFLTSKSGLYDNRFNAVWKKLTKRGWKVFFLSFTVLLMLGLQEWNSERNEINKDKAIESERFKQEKLTANGISKGIEANRKKLFSDLSEAFAKQKLEFNPLKKEINDLKDSLTILIPSPEGLPVLNILYSDDKNGNDSFKIKGTFYMDGASGRIKYLDDFWEIHFTDGTVGTLPKERLIYGPIDIAQDLSITKGTEVWFLREIKYINIAIIGKFSTLLNRNVINYAEVFQYNLINKTTQQLDANARARFLNKYRLQ